MVYCVSCQKYPMDENVIPYGSTFPIDTFTVDLISDSPPSTLPSNGSDVENLADGTKFAVGSTLFVRKNSEGRGERYIYLDGSFKLYNGIKGDGITVSNIVVHSDGSVRIG